MRHHGHRARDQKGKKKGRRNLCLTFINLYLVRAGVDVLVTLFPEDCPQSVQVSGQASSQWPEGCTLYLSVHDG